MKIYISHRRGRGFSRRGLRRFGRGFLLLEVVLAMGIAALVLGGVFAIAQGALALSETLSRTGREGMRQISFFGFLERNFEGLPGNAIFELRSIDDGRHYLSDVTIQNAPVSFSWAGQPISAQAVQLSTEKGADGMLDIKLKYFAEPIIDEQGVEGNKHQEPIAELILYRDVWRFEWKVLDVQNDEWVTEWDAVDRKPPQLELNVVFHANGEEVLHYFWIPNKVSPEVRTRAVSSDGDDSEQVPGQGGGGNNPNPNTGGSRQ